MNAPDDNIDCVGMKRRIQDELRKKWGNTPWSERNQRVRAAAMADRHLARHVRPRVDAARPVDLSRFEGTITLSEDPVAHQRRMREEQ